MGDQVGRTVGYRNRMHRRMVSGIPNGMVEIWNESNEECANVIQNAEMKFQESKSNVL